MQATCSVLDLTSEVVLQSTFPQGLGGFSDVFRAVAGHCRIEGKDVENQVVAVKVLRIVGNCTVERAAKRLTREVEACNRLRHPNVVDLYGICFFAGRPGLVLPWYDNGTASSFLGGRSLTMKLDIIRDVARGLAYAHSQNVVHGDLKGSNILITDNGHAVLTDFGLARVTDALGPTGNTTSSAAGSIRWQAPELFIGMSSEVFTMMLPKQRSKASDIWAFACTVYELVTEKLPYHNLHDSISIARAVTTGILPLQPEDTFIFSLPRLYEVLLVCWKLRPVQRASMTDILCQL